MLATQFRIELNEYADEIDEVILLIMQKLALEGLSRVVLRSPVDTGRFRGNWTVTVGQPTLATSEALDKSGQDTINRGSAIIQSVSELRPIYLQNNLPYGPRLEGGWSKQAPAGMMGLTFADLELMF